MKYSIISITFLTDGYARTPGPFIYSLRNNDGLSPFKSTLKHGSEQYAIDPSSGYGPTFGAGWDLHIASDAGSNTNSYTKFGLTYNLPHGYNFDHANTNALLGGSFRFTPSEVEVLCLN